MGASNMMIVIYSIIFSVDYYLIGKIKLILIILAIKRHFFIISNCIRVETILKINTLTKRYGAVKAVQNLDLEIRQGQVYGILGPNGSGKTTTLGIILGIINADSGSFHWSMGQSLSQALKSIGSIIESPAFYPYLSAVKNLRIVADIKGRGEGDIEDVLTRVGLYERRNNSYSGYSLGMKQRLALGAAMLGKPEVLVLDEPTNGMDPQGIADIRNLINDIAAEGTTILLASHLLDEVQKTCSHVAVLSKGNKIFDGSVQDILQADEYIEIKAEDNEALFSLLKSFKGIEEMSREVDIFIVRLAPGPSKKDLHKYLIENGIYPTHFSARAGSLEQKFLELLKTSQ